VQLLFPVCVFIALFAIPYCYDGGV